MVENQMVVVDGQASFLVVVVGHVEKVVYVKECHLQEDELNVVEVLWWVEDFVVVDLLILVLLDLPVFLLELELSMYFLI